MARSVFETLTTPPPPRPPTPKHPLLTTSWTSTKSFGPGHLVGAGILVLGIYGLTKFVVARGQAEAERTRRLAEQPQPPRRPGRPEDEPALAQAENERGQYGTSARSP